MTRVEMMVETRNFVDGSVEVVVCTPYGEQIASMRVSTRAGFTDEFAEHEVEVAYRDENFLVQDHCVMIGSKALVRVPLSAGEQAALGAR